MSDGLSEQQVHDLVERLHQHIAKCEDEGDRWRGTHPEIAAEYDGERRAYKYVLDRIAWFRHPPGAPGVAERETRPPGEPVEATP